LFGDNPLRIASNQTHASVTLNVPTDLQPKGNRTRALPARVDVRRRTHVGELKWRWRNLNILDQVYQLLQEARTYRATVLANAVLHGVEGGRCGNVGGIVT
jgi:hypothetical protein